ncbi:MAG: hypothetical protein ABH873_07055, partial [Candidatus Firestonebacteria bacterium]
KERMMNLLYQKTETDNEVIYTFRNLWIIYVIILAGALLVLEGSYKYIGEILLVFGLLCLIPVRTIISKAKREGSKMEGSEWSLKKITVTNNNYSTNKQTIVKINKWWFFLCFYIYCIVSFFGFYLTSSGWTRLFFFTFGGIFVCSVILFVFLVSLLVRHKKKYFVFNKKALIPVFISQVLAILFSFGDCGDRPGGRYNFFEVLLGINGHHICNKPLLGKLAFPISMWLCGIYLLVLVCSLIYVHKAKE